MGQSFQQAMRGRQQAEEEEKRREAEIRIEEKKRELEENMRQEELLLSEARRRSQPGDGSSPPPLPSSPPPRETPPPTVTSTGTARLDMLLGNGSGASPARKESPSKRVSFMPPEEREEEEQHSRDEEDEAEEDGEEEEDDFNEHDKDSIEASADRQDPNAFISEAENLLNPAMSKLDFTEGGSGHTPSVIGTQEVYRDPRSRMLLEKQEKKLSTERPPDGAKLSFKEKMKLFAQEVGENTPRDKAKISKAQREIDSVE